MTSPQRDRIFQALMRGSENATDPQLLTVLECMTRLDLEAIEPIIDEFISDALQFRISGFTSTPAIEDGYTELMVDIVPDGEELIVRAQVGQVAHQFHIRKEWATLFADFLREKATA